MSLESFAMVVHLQPHFLSRTSPCGFQTRRNAKCIHSVIDLELRTTLAALKEIGINNTDSSLSLCLSLILKKILSEIYMWSFKGNQESEA